MELSEPQHTVPKSPNVIVIFNSAMAIVLIFIIKPFPILVPKLLNSNPVKSFPKGVFALRDVGGFCPVTDST